MYFTKSARAQGSFLVAVIISLLISGCSLNALTARTGTHALAAPSVVNQPVIVDEGIRFVCSPARLERVATDMPKYLVSIGIAPSWVVTRADPANGALIYTLNTPKGEFETLSFRDRPEFAIRDHVDQLPAKDGKTTRVVTVSRKEIVLALLQHGRVTNFDGLNCDLDALREHVELRQNIVSWAENLSWEWPDGGYAEWSTKYWKRGTPLPAVSLHEAFADVFKNQGEYSIGCYTATKLVMVQGVLDYYHRVRPNPAVERLIEARLQLDHDPLVNIEPGKMWSFETDFDQSELARPGKLLKLKSGIAPGNFVPGDWVYFLNTDPVSSLKTGYEGSNAIYLGRNKFSDYYDDNDHAYEYLQKVDEVYQWRHGVFSRSRDADKIRPLSEQEIRRLGMPPAHGGILMDIRAVPYFFGRSELPEMLQH